MILINGKAGDTLGISDRATQYGDGCFTTMLVEQGAVRLWPYHLSRLQHTLQVLAIAEPDWETLTLEVERLAAQFADKGGIKILISRGAGGRGYSPVGCQQTTVIVSDFAWPVHYEQWQADGITLGVCQQRLALSPMLAGHKHLNRLEQVMLKREAEQNGWLDAVVLDVNGCVVEAIASNIFWRQGNVVFTPELDMSGVHGVMRSHIIDLCKQLGYCLEFVKTPLDNLLCADEVFITNALMALVPVNEIKGKQFTERTLLNALNKRLYTC